MVELPGAVACVGLVAAFGWAVSWSTRPLRQVAKKRSLPVRITWQDFMCLFSLVHLTSIVFYGLIGPVSLAILGHIYVYTWIGWGILWADSVVTLSRAGITGGMLRIVFLMASPALIVLGMVAQGTALMMLFKDSMATALGIEAASIGVFYGCGLFVRWLTTVPGTIEAKPAEFLVKELRENLSGSFPQKVTRGAIAWDIMLLSLPMKSLACVMEPVERAAQERRKPAQFTIADMLCLFLLVHASSAVAYYLSSKLPGEVKTAEYIFGWTMWGALWWVSVRKLSRAGVTKPLHRAIFLLAIIPWLVVGSFLQLGVWMYGFSIMTYISRTAALLPLLGTFASAMVLIAIFYVCAWFTYRIVAVAGNEERKDEVHNQENQEAASGSP